MEGKREEFSTEFWTLPILHRTLNQVLEDEKKPLSLLLLSLPHPHWVNYFYQHLPKRRQKRTRILGGSPSDHPKPLSTLLDPPSKWEWLSRSLGQFLEHSRSQPECSFCMLLMFPSANQGQSTGVQSHLPDLGGPSFKFLTLRASNENKTTLSVLSLSNYSLDRKL